MSEDKRAELKKTAQSLLLSIVDCLTLHPMQKTLNVERAIQLTGKYNAIIEILNDSTVNVILK